MYEKTVKISVRQLVEFILRSGDIVAGAGGFAEIDAMQQGTKAHKKLQKEAGPNYKAEVPLSHTSEFEDGLVIMTDGRADGVITESVLASGENGELVVKDRITIDEIKGSFRNVEHFTEPAPVHLAQAMCYAYFYAVSHDLETIGIQVTYVNLKKGTVRRFNEERSFEELEKWYGDLIEEYAGWIRWRMQWERERNASIHRMTFPFEYRPSQKKLVSGIYQTIIREKRIFIQAPTGTGKTISAVYPSLQTLAQEKVSHIFYLTAKTIARTVAEDTFALLQDRGLQTKVLTLTAKEKLCVLEVPHCNPLNCLRARGHFDRVNEAVKDILQHEDRINREVIELYAAKHQVCPFEMQLDVSLWVDVVICDYNYVFDPDVSLKRFFSDKPGSYLFLIDEAHNLVERARDMYSAVLSLNELEIYKRQLLGTDKKLSEYLNKAITYLKMLREETEQECQLQEDPGTLSVYLYRIQENLERLLRLEMADERLENLSDLYFLVRDFLHAFERLDERYLVYSLRKDRDFKLKIFCVDPSRDLGQRLATGKSAVFFSATLLPVNYYKEMLSDSAKEDYDFYVDSPFDPAKRLLVIADDVSSKYTRRGPAEYEKIATYISRIIRGRHGNYLAFFPSYQMMEAVFDIFTAQELVRAGHGLSIVKQESEMQEDARQQFLEAFESGTGRRTLGFCVMGGIFSEGIDLKEDRLIGTIIVGTGLPGVDGERQLLQDYFNARSGNGFDYAYLYPGMNKVQQAAGRVIRTEKDQGIIALLDERFHYSAYRNIFPREWTDYSRTNLSQIQCQIEQFWDQWDWK